MLSGGGRPLGVSDAELIMLAAVCHGTNWRGGSFRPRFHHVALYEIHHGAHAKDGSS
jgi:hypothetical protein